MDTLGSSTYSLNRVNNQRAVELERRREQQFKAIIQSTGSLSRYESKSFKNLLPQILASSISGLFHVVVGISLAYSAILLPQLKEPTSDIQITEKEGAWIASIITITIPVSGLLCGILMDRFGRLTTVKLATIPAVIGWVTIATANSVPALIIGRVITGFAAAWGTSPAMVYITEIARADLRGSMMSFAPTYTSLGFVLAYLQGWLMPWRMVAWLCNIYAVIPFVLLFFIPESPPWLISKGKYDDARESLRWFGKYQPQPPDKSQTFAELQLQALIEEREEKMKTSQNKGIVALAKQFLKPTGFKPLLILLGLFVFQQFSGIYITLFYSIAFFREVGSNLDPYFTSILIGVMRLIMSIVNTFMLKTFNRRTLILSGSAGMAVCMFVSGLYTYRIKDGSTSLTWVPIVAILFYVVASMIGLLSIPWTMTAEMFPIEIRGLAHSVVYSSAYLFMFLSIQMYTDLKDFFNGVAGLQWFFAVTSLAGLVYAYVLLPETQGVKLSEIQNYFLHNSVYIGGINKGTDIINTITPIQIHNNNNEQTEGLLDNNV